MRLEKSKSESNVIPEDLKVNVLGNDLYEIIKNDNIESFEKDHEGEVEAMFKCDKIILRTTIKTRGDAIVAFIRLKHDGNDEYSLINKGISDRENLEYSAYRDYVAWCKEQASVYFDF